MTASPRRAHDGGLTPQQYEKLLGEQCDLHALHRRRARFSAEEEDRLRRLPAQRVLVITEPWCGDSLAVLPVALTLFERIPGSSVRIVRRDEHPELMDRFLTNGGRAVPMIVALDAEDGVRFRWGPRPAPAQAILEAHRAALRAGTVERAEVSAKIRGFYSKDRGRTIIAELTDLLCEETSVARATARADTLDGGS